MDITGAAQKPAHEFQIVRKHPVGHKRARMIAIENGVFLDEAVTILRVNEKTRMAGTNAHACYFSLEVAPNDVVRFEDLFSDGRIFISMHRSVFLSDESIVAHLAHELHEVRGLTQAFAEADGWMRARDLFELIRAGKKGNLHDQAWDEANRVVEVMRAQQRTQD